MRSLEICCNGMPTGDLGSLASRAFTMVIWRLVGCFGFSGPYRQYFSLYRAVSQREGEKGEKG